MQGVLETRAGRPLRAAQRGGEGGALAQEHLAVRDTGFTQLDFFSDPEEDRRKEEQAEELKREKRRQKAVLTIKKKYGKNAIVKGMNLEEGATAMDRNGQIGGHKA